MIRRMGILASRYWLFLQRDAGTPILQNDLIVLHPIIVVLFLVFMWHYVLNVLVCQAAFG